MSKNFKYISEKKNILELRKKIEKMVDNPLSINKEFLRKNNWKVFIEESASHFNRKDARKISLAMRKYNVNQCYVIETDLESNPPKFILLENSIENILKLNFEFQLQGLALVSDTFQHLVLSTIEDFIVIAGEDYFIKLIGKNSKKMEKKFQEFANDPFWDIDKKELLLSMKNYYHEFFNW